MDSQFPEWYAIVNLASTSETTQKRWAAIEKFTSSINSGAIVDLARLFFRLPRATSSTEDGLRQSARDLDSTFPASGHDEELALLAGAALLKSATSAEYGTACLLALIAPAFPDRTGPVPQIIARAKHELHKRSQNLRKRKDAQLGTLSLPEDFDEKLEEFTTKLHASQLPEASSAGEDLFIGLRDSFKELASSFASARSDQILGREESDIWWWIYSGYSVDLETPHNELHQAQQCLVIAHELASLVTVLPGPVAANNLIKKALANCGGDEKKKISLSSAVTKLDVTYRQRLSKDITPQHEGLLPIATALSASLRVDKEKDWLPIFKKAVGYPATTTFFPSEIAYQYYVELIAVRALGKGD